MPTTVPPLRRHRPTGGFTLVEVLVVLAIASVVFLLLTRWVLTLGEVSATNLAHAAAARATGHTDVRLRADLDRGTVCDPGTGTPIRTLRPGLLELYTAADFTVGGPATYLVRWERDGQRLTRTQTLLDTDCRPLTGDGATYGTRVIADGLRPAGGAATFTGHHAGQPVGGCETTETTTTSGGVRARAEGTGCAASTLLLDIAAEPAGVGGGHDRLRRPYPISTRGETR